MSKKKKAEQYHNLSNKKETSSYYLWFQLKPDSSCLLAGFRRVVGDPPDPTWQFFFLKKTRLFENF